VACAGAGSCRTTLSLPVFRVSCLPEFLLHPFSFDEAAFYHGRFGGPPRDTERPTSSWADVVAVIGLGLLGQLTVADLQGSPGCCVLGMDISSDRAESRAPHGSGCGNRFTFRISRFGCLQHSAGQGADSLSSQRKPPATIPVNLAGFVARNRAVVVAWEPVAMDIPRSTFLRTRSRLPHFPDPTARAGMTWPTNKRN